MFSKNLKWFLLILCFIFSGVKAISLPSEVVKMTAESVISHIDENRSVLEKNPEKIYDMVDQLIIPRFDFVSMSKWVLGKHWKQASEEQRSEFIIQFKELLVRTYARALLEYSGQEIKYFPVEQNPESNLAVVRTELTSKSSAQLPILYRMHQKNEEWKVVDVSVDGVSLVTTYRGSFATQIKKNGFDSLLNELSKKNARLEKTISN
jgi:phospholipid transport system substrate-binding protein